MTKTSQHLVERSYHSNMPSIFKLNLKCQVAFMLTDNVCFVKIGLNFEKLRRFKYYIFESSDFSRPLVTKHLKNIWKK